MYNKSDYQLLVMQASIEANRQDYDEKMKKLIEDLIAMIESMMDKFNISKYSPDNNYYPKPPDPATVVPSNKRDPSF